MNSNYTFYNFLNEVRAMSLTPMQYLTLMNKVRVYFEYRKHFDAASTPEGVALARWGMQDAERDYDKFCREIGIKAPSLYKLRHAVY